VAFLGEPEDYIKSLVVQNSADKIAQEMTKKGTPITKEILMQNGIEVKRIIGVDKVGKRNSYEVVTIKHDGKAIEYPLAILDNEKKTQGEVDMNKLFDMVGMDYAITSAWDEENKAPWDEWLKEADILVPDSASTQKSMDKYGLEFLNSYFKRTRENNQGFRMNSVFWDAGDVSAGIQGETNPDKVEQFMRGRLSQLMKLRPTEMNIVLEPFDLVEGNFDWAKTPWYNVYGEDWPVKAFQFAQEEAKKLGIVLGKHIKLYWNDFGLDHPGQKLDLTLGIIDKIIQAGYHIDGIGLQIYNGKNNKYNPHVPNQDEIFQVIEEVRKRQLSTYIEYCVYRNPEDTPELVPVGTEIVETCKEANENMPGAVSSFNLWDNYNPDSTLDPDSYAFYDKKTYTPNMNYYNLQAQMVGNMAQV